MVLVYSVRFKVPNNQSHVASHREDILTIGCDVLAELGMPFLLCDQFSMFAPQVYPTTMTSSDKSVVYSQVTQEYILLRCLLF